MTFRQLNNGIRVVLDPMPHLHSISLGVWVNAGSVFENDRNSGISHFIEHMVFKGTTHRSAAEIATEMDAIGANLNAWFDSPIGRTALGMEMRYEDLVSTTLGETLNRPHHIHHTSRDYTKGLNRTNLQLFVEHNIVIDRFTLSAGITAVDNSQADMNMRVYPGIDVSWRFADGWKLYAGYNSSLRMPSFTELYYSVGGHKADSHLKPEELSAIEAGVKYQRGGVNAVATVFHNHYKNLIDWINDGSLDESGNEYWQSVNFGKINALGVETNVALDFRTLLPAQRLLKSFSAGWCWINQKQDRKEGVISVDIVAYNTKTGL